MEKRQKILLIVFVIVLISVAVYFFINNGASDSIKKSIEGDSSVEVEKINRKYRDVKKLEIESINNEDLDYLIDRSVDEKNIEEIDVGKKDPFQSIK